MAGRTLKRHGLEGTAKALIALGALLILLSWAIGAYYFWIMGRAVILFIAPFIFTCVLAVLLLMIRYRYTLFEKYPYLMNLPSLFYRIAEKKNQDNRGVAFSMIFTVHALVIAFLGVLSIVLTLSISTSIKGSATSWAFLYIYLALVAVLIISVLFQYRRIYIRFAK